MHSTDDLSPGKRLIAVLLTGPLVVFGALYAFAAASELREWQAMRPSLVACLVAISAAAAIMLASGLWLIARLFRDRRPLWIGGIAAAVSGVVLAGGALAQVIPCSGPT